MESLAFYNRHGKPVAYLHNGEYIYSFPGEPIAYIYNEEHIYLFSGQHIGWFKDGWILDSEGYCLFFTKISSGGPLKPLKSLKPLKGLKSMKPMKSMKEMRPMRKTKRLSWSSVSFNQFFNID